MATVEMNVLVPALAALAGAVVGSIPPIVVGWIQARAELVYHSELLDLILKGEEVTPAQFVELRKRSSAVFDTLDRYQQERERKPE